MQHWLWFVVAAMEPNDFELNLTVTADFGGWTGDLLQIRHRLIVAFEQQTRSEWQRSGDGDSRGSQFFLERT